MHSLRYRNLTLLPQIYNHEYVFYLVFIYAALNLVCNLWETPVNCMLTWVYETDVLHIHLCLKNLLLLIGTVLI